MNNSNYTLRFSRSAREAYGTDIEFGDQKNVDMPVIGVCIFGFGVVVGLLLSGVLPW